jgi:DnaJ-class molecular chaperone
MPGKDYYQILGVGRNSTEKEIKQAYRRLARKYHPDVNPGNKSAEARFKEINEAQEILTDPEKRKKYDQFGNQWQSAEQFAKSAQGAPRDFRRGGTYSTSDFDLNDLDGLGGIFGDILRGAGGAGFRTAQRPRKGQDIDHPIEVTLEEAYHGAKRFIEMQSEEPCPTCGSRGIVGKRPCSTCGGSGLVIRPKMLEVKIPPGVTTGSRVRIAGQGRSGPGGAKGDLYLVVTVLPHRMFERKADDLYVDVPVPLVAAILGGETEVPTLKGKLALRIPPETDNGKVFRLAGQGIPHLGDSSYGDLFARVSVVLPKNLTQKEKALFEQLRANRPI